MAQCSRDGLYIMVGGVAAVGGRSVMERRRRWGQNEERISRELMAATCKRLCFNFHLELFKHY